MSLLLNALLGEQNPLAKWTSANSNTLTGLGASLLSDGMNFTPLQQGRLADQELARQQKEDDKKLAQNQVFKDWLTKTRPDLAPLMDAGVSSGDLFNEVMKPKDKGLGLVNVGGGSLYDPNTGQWLHDPNAAPDGTADLKTGFTPVWGTVDGKQTVALPGNDGKFYVDGKPIDTTKFIPTNPYDLNAQKAAGGAFGKATGGTQFSVPNAQLELDQSLAATGKLQEPDVQKGMEDWFKQWGALPRGAWVQGGTNMAKFQNAANNVIDRSWLSARAALKGSGPITDYESAKAENAVSAMKTALASGDKASYEAAVQDYEYWIKQGFAKLQMQAGAMAGYGASGQPPMPTGDPDIEGILSGLGI